MIGCVIYRILADVILVLHVLFVVFVLLGLILILVGGGCGWRWVRRPWFRMIHLAAIAMVVIQSWFHWECPLTTWENMLRLKAGEQPYAGDFIAHWLHNLLFYEAESWVFVLCYTLFGLLVLASWFWVRPEPFGTRRDLSQGRGDAV